MSDFLPVGVQRQLGTANAGSAKSIEKLSSGYRINRAGDDAAGLAISEKMRGQIRGLNQASANSQDGISMIQTAEGALGETHAILQRMRELAVQSSNDTNVDADRSEIQKEMNQLTTEINRIGNTTEFNTQAVLKGDGKANLTETGKAKNGNLDGGDVTTVEATQTTTLKAVATTDQTAIFKLNGEEITITFATNGVAADNGKSSNVTANGATVNLHAASGTVTTDADSITAALKEVIEKNDKLKGNFTVSNTEGAITVAATKTGAFSGKDGNIAAYSGTAGGTITGGLASIGTTTEVKAVLADAVDFSSATDAASALKFAGTGFTVGDKQIELYNADDGAYTGNAIGVNISGAANAANIISAIVDQAGSKVDDVTFSTGTAGHLTITAKNGGKAGNDIKVKDGGVQENFKSNFQVGANQGQSMTIEIKDMRANALGLTGKAGADGFTAGNSVTNGTNNTTVEAAVDVSSHEAASASITLINNAIEKVSAQRSDLGSFQNRLEHTIKNLDTSSENLQAAEARIRDVDMAKEMMEQTKQNILAQASTAMLAQANQHPQGVLQLLR